MGKARKATKAKYISVNLVACFVPRSGDRLSLVAVFSGRSSVEREEVRKADKVREGKKGNRNERFHNVKLVAC